VSLEKMPVPHAPIPAQNRLGTLVGRCG